MAWEWELVTHKQLEMHGCVFNTTATDAVVLRHQASSIHSAEEIFIALVGFHTKILHIQRTIFEKNIFWKKWPSGLRVDRRL